MNDCSWIYWAFDLRSSGTSLPAPATRLRLRHSRQEGMSRATKLRADAYCSNPKT